MFQSISDLKTRYVLTIENIISTSKETFKSLLNTRIIVSSNKTQLLQKKQMLMT